MGSALALMMTPRLLPAMQGLEIQSSQDENACSTPPWLRKGDCIAIVSPSGTIKREDIQPAVDKLQEWGFRVKVGDSVGKKDFTRGGTDEERASDLQQQLNDVDVKAILCARGGYGLVRIIDRIDFSPLKKHPKWIIGFSDATVLHSHIKIGRAHV